MKTNSLFVLSIIIIALSNPAFAGKLYKWVDENGNISFSDKIQPKDSRLERETLNEKGRTIAVKDAAKTPEELKQFKKINALQKTQEKILQSQLASDAALLKTFRTEDDMTALANSKFEMLDSHISISNGQSETLKKQLMIHQKAAAKFEREGKKIPTKNVANIASAQGQFDKNQHEIVAYKQQKEDVAEQLANNKNRFKILTLQTAEKPSIHSETIPSLFLGEISCQANSCEGTWKSAVEFISQKDAIVIFTSDNLVLTKTPRLSKDKGLSLTKAQSETGSLITLDIRCADSKGGKATCKSPQTAQLVDEFNQLAN
jgi:hypothetical protein